MSRRGQYEAHKIPITSNVYEIPERLADINENYFVMYDTDSSHYELHDSSLYGDTLLCIFPFDELDIRALNYVYENSYKTPEEVAYEVEEYNEKLAKKKEEEILCDANYKMRDAFNYLKNNTKTDSIPKELISDDS